MTPSTLFRQQAGHRDWHGHARLQHWYGINGRLGDVDHLTLTVRPLRSSRCTVTVMWGITSW
ncbi:hypothetical protein AB0G67_46980 [Streptomyces sp. NPDC021056]|uniref:hypothetical protein n=1 Tax=Streptomyces sp. NPDC021056 TaxID=3155012 RepID=UPI0033D08CF8